MTSNQPGKRSALTLTNLAAHTSAVSPAATRPASSLAGYSQPMSAVSQAMDTMNTAALRRAIPTFESIVSKAAHVTLYTYSPSASDSPWKDCQVNGPMFLITLTPDPEPTEASEIAIPRYAIVIFNRAGLRNFVLELVDLEGLATEEGYIFLANQVFPTEILLPDTKSGTSNLSTSSTASNVTITSTPRNTAPAATTASRALHSRYYGLPNPNDNNPSVDKPIWGLWVYAEGSTVMERVNIFESMKECVTNAKTACEMKQAREKSMWQNEGQARQVAEQYKGLEFDYQKGDAGFYGGGQGSGS